MVVHSGIAIMARRWRKPAKKIDRRRSNPSSSIGIKNYTRLKAEFLVGPQAILLSKSLRKVFTMFMEPFAGGLAITIVKFGMRGSISVINIPAVPARRHDGTGQRE